MVWWPGWDSVSDSAWWAQFWFWIGILCLVGLGASQLVSHVYGVRQAALVTAERIAVERIAVARFAAASRRSAEIEAQSKRPPAPVKPPDRHLGEDQRRILAEQLKERPGLPVSLVLLEDREAANYGEELVTALQAAGVAVVGLSRRNVLLPAPVGLRIWTEKGDERAAALLGAFAKANVVVTPLNGDLDARAAHIVVGVNGAPATASR